MIDTLLDNIRLSLILVYLSPNSIKLLPLSCLRPVLSREKSETRSATVFGHVADLVGFQQVLSKRKMVFGLPETKKSCKQSVRH